ncbi:MAG TPA: hypothetical protein VFX51_02345 [Solirubrobacteraceae bacterium]|nr:hypothetical protein [Solirubrobacteraceae bacterium]
MRLALSLLTAVAALVAVPAAQAQTINCGRVNSTHGRGATFIHYDVMLELETSDTTTCDEASQVVSTWLETGDPVFNEWLCQSSHGVADVIGTCSKPTASVTATGEYEVAVEKRCGNVRAFSTSCRSARRVAKKVKRDCTVMKGQRPGIQKGCKVSGYRCKDRKVNARTSKVRCLRGQRREVDFRLR